jgi:hypothetical protein
MAESGAITPEYSFWNVPQGKYSTGGCAFVMDQFGPSTLAAASATLLSRCVAIVHRCYPAMVGRL